MKGSVYTLLIVESPVISRIIQNSCPSSVYVIPTGGYCWKPGYDPVKNQLKAVADPKKIALRKELKEQAKWANSVIIASDSDPAGDFITWSIAKFLKNPGLKRTRILSLSKSGIYDMLDEAREFDANRLEIALQNRFMLLHEWKKSTQLPDYHLSGLISIFGHSTSFNHFADENGTRFKSSATLQAAPGECITVTEDKSDEFYTTEKPLSTFDILGKIVGSKLAVSYDDAMQLLQELFQSQLPFTGESLISYPRTGARAFYSETWNDIRRQFIQFGSQGDLKPVFMQEIADPDTPHESVHPINLSLTPQKVAGELSGRLGKLYGLIYEHTRSSITIPSKVNQAYTNELQSGIIYYAADGKPGKATTLTLRPVYTTSDLGTLLHQFGICTPSGFGKQISEWASKGWIKIENDTVTPGSFVLKRLNQAELIYRKLNKLKYLIENNSLDIETVRSIISS